MLELVAKVGTLSWWMEVLAGTLVGVLLLLLLSAPRLLLWCHAAGVVLALSYCAVALPPGASMAPGLGWFGAHVFVPVAVTVCFAAAVGTLTALGSRTSQRFVGWALSAWAVLMVYGGEIMYLEWAAHIAIWSALSSYAWGATLIAQLLSLPTLARAVARNMAQPSATI